MGKSSKKFDGKAPKPITDFFKPKALSQSSSQATVASNSNAPSSSKPNINTTASSETAASRSTSSTHLPYAVNMQEKPQRRVSKDTISRRKALQSPTEHITQIVPLSITSLKRSRSPDTQRPALSPLRLKQGQKPHPETSKSPARRKAKVNTDSDLEQRDSVVYVKRTQNPQLKKRRISSPGPSSHASASSLVPSSQSDEEELAPSRSKVRGSDVKETVDYWRKQALPPSPDVEHNDIYAAQMDMDSFLSSSPLTSRFTSPFTEPENNTELKDSPAPTSSLSPVFGHIPTPPYTHRRSDNAPMPPTPVALDPATKTAQIIAGIKARAYEQSLLSPERSPPPEFKDELSDSSDDEMLPFVPVPVKGKSAITLNAVNVVSTSKSRSTRYSLRDRTSSPVDGDGKLLEEGSRGEPTPAVVPHGGSHKKWKGAAKRQLAVNPLDAFLKEKRLAEKGGKGLDAFHRAETVAIKQGKNSLFDEMADEQAECAALQAVKERDQWLNKPLSPDNTFTSPDAIVLVDEDRRRLFGENGGKAIMGILESDRVAKNEAQAHEKVQGMQFWKTPELGGMVVDEPFPTIQFEGDDSILQIFKSALDRGDFVQASLLLDTGFLFSNKGVIQPQVNTYLCNLALSMDDAPIHAAAFRALLRLYSSRPNPSVGITLSCVLGTLHRLGGMSSTMSSMGWATEASAPSPSIDTKSREDVLYRLVELVALCARSQRLVVEDTPDLVAALLLVAADPSTSLPLQRDITMATNQICNSIDPEDEVFPEIEARICSKILNCIARCQPINKAYLLSFLAAGSGRTLRIARYAAFCIVTNQATAILERYSDLPPIPEVLDKLLPTSSDRSITDRGIFDLHDGTDYVDLGFYVYILGVAISNVKGYALEERKEARSKYIGRHSPSKLVSGEDKAKTPLQILHQALETLHSGITDTRAAHLDRSRTKAAVKALSVRIYYQREGWIKGHTDRTGKPRMNLRQYFPTKS